GPGAFSNDGEQFCANDPEADVVLLAGNGPYLRATLLRPNTKLGTEAETDCRALNGAHILSSGAWKILPVNPDNVRVISMSSTGLRMAGARSPLQLPCETAAHCKSV